MSTLATSTKPARISGVWLRRWDALQLGGRLGEEVVIWATDEAVICQAQDVGDSSL